MLKTQAKREKPFRLVVTGESKSWLPALETLVGAQWIQPCPVGSDGELMTVVQNGQADAAVLDDEVDWSLDVLRVLRMIRRLDATFPVVVVTRQRDRHHLQAMLELRAYSVLARPVELEQLLRQIHGMMIRLDQVLRGGGTW